MSAPSASPKSHIPEAMLSQSRAYEERDGEAHEYPPHSLEHAFTPASRGLVVLGASTISRAAVIWIEPVAHSELIGRPPLLHDRIDV